MNVDCVSCDSVVRALKDKMKIFLLLIESTK